MLGTILTNWGYMVVGVLAALAFAGLMYVFVHVAGPLLRFLPLAHRVRYVKDPIPSSWPPIVDRNVPAARALDAEAKERLLRLTQVFLRDVPMEGCAGLVLDEEMRVTIAAGACLLLLNMRYPWFPKLRHILVYPEVFAPARVPSHHGGIEEAPKPTAGEAWRNGTVILSWRSVQAGSEATDDGYNVVLHEFAHVLDSEDGFMDGVPILEPPSSPRAWSRLLAEQFGKQARLVEAGHKTALREYGATNPAEFFAVATEVFFEKPRFLREREPALYEELRKFYRQDPAERAAPASS